MSHVPLFTGASIGLASSRDQDQVPVHKAAFDRIDAIAKRVRRHVAVALSLGRAPAGTSAGAGVRAASQALGAANATGVTSLAGSAPPYIVSACTPQAPV